MYKKIFYGILVLILSNCDGAQKSLEDNISGLTASNEDILDKNFSSDDMRGVSLEKIDISSIPNDLYQDNPAHQEYLEQLDPIIESAYEEELVSEFYTQEVSDQIIVEADGQYKGIEREHTLHLKKQSKEERIPSFIHQTRKKHLIQIEYSSSLGRHDTQVVNTQVIKNIKKQPKIDLVVVVDHSSLMKEKIKNLKMESLLMGLEGSDLEVRLTSTSSYWKKKRIFAKTFPAIEGHILKSRNPEMFGQLAEKFNNIVEQISEQEGGDGHAKGLLSALVAIEEKPLRDNATLIVLVVSDKDESCLLDPETFERNKRGKRWDCAKGKSFFLAEHFLGALGKRNKIAGQNFFFYGIFIAPYSDDHYQAKTRCANYREYSTRPAHQYHRVVELSRGSYGSICTDLSEYPAMLQSMAKHIKNKLEMQYRSVSFTDNAVSSTNTLFLSEYTDQSLENIIPETFTVILEEKDKQLPIIEEGGEIPINGKSIAYFIEDSEKKELVFNTIPTDGTLINVIFETETAPKSQFCDQSLLLPQGYKNLEIKVGGKNTKAQYHKDPKEEKGCLSFETPPPLGEEISGSYRIEQLHLSYPLALSDPDASFTLMELGQGGVLDKEALVDRVENNTLFFKENAFSLEEFDHKTIIVKEKISLAEPREHSILFLPDMIDKQIEILEDTLQLQAGDISCTVSNGELQVEGQSIIIQENCQIPEGRSFYLNYRYMEQKLFIEDPKGLLQDTKKIRLWRVHMNDLPLGYEIDPNEYYIQLKDLELPIEFARGEFPVSVSIKVIDKSSF